MADYKITLLKGDGIGPEIVNQAVKVLDCAAEKFGFGVTYDEALLGGCAIDATGVPLPDETVAKCKASDSVLLGAVGGPKWDSQPGNNRPDFSVSEAHSDFSQIFVRRLFSDRSRVHHLSRMKSSVATSML